MQRQPAVAGQFYPGSPELLRNELARLVPVSDEKRRVRGIIVPHAGYVYSGGIAGKAYAMSAIPAAALILGPNHHGVGEPAALYPGGEWLTPLGPTAINIRLNNLIKKRVPFVRDDTVAHRFEHSLEVQLPFLQFLRPDITCSALCLGQGDFEILREIGEGIAASIAEYDEDVLIVASSDMTHYESAASAKRKDSLALERVLAFDPRGLLQVCQAERISMCGAVAAAVMLVAAEKLGATRAELVAYGTSGDVTGDNQQVVGYASLLVD
ncbi:MAG: AmmeMemoRadiSam system protein B [Desulfuromonadales bacterium]|nr:AmmeMemoRadiSam system protein B [Desulfuromonadales bacterium]